MEDLNDYLTQIDVDQAKEIYHYYLGVALNAAFVWTLIIFALIQYCYISNLRKMAKSQKQLEEVFMGAEIMAAPTAAPAIQYIVVPADQYPAYANQG